MSKHILQKCEPTKNMSLPRAVAPLQGMLSENWASAIEGYRDKAIRSCDVHRCLALMPGTANPIYYRVLLLPNIENDLKEGDVGECE